MDEKDPLTTIPVRQSTKTRLHQYKQPKKNREKYEHMLETLNDLINRLLDFYDNHQISK